MFNTAFIAIYKRLIFCLHYLNDICLINIKKIKKMPINMVSPYKDTDERPLAYKRDIYIVGHIFTQRLNHVDEKGRGKIFECKKYRGYHIVDMDCGMAINSRSSRLGCRLLETGEDFYVSLMDEDEE